MRRLLFDTTYTRLQRENVGITRTVRRLFEELQHVGPPLQAVAFGGSVFRAVGAPEVPAAADHLHGPGLVFRLATSRAGKQIISQLTKLPWPVLRWVLELGSARAYAHAAAPVEPAAGDVLLLCDASWNYAPWRAARDARRRGAAVVTMVHDLMPLRHPAFIAPLVVRIYAGWLREMLRGSDAVICNSASTAQDLRAWAGAHGLLLPPVGHFRLGADPRQHGNDRPVRPEIEAFLAGPAPCFAAVGSVEPKKNYGFLLDAFEHLWEQGVQARLLIAGRLTAEWAAMGARLMNHPQRGRMLLAVFDADDAEISRIYEGCRALVFPSLMEGFGLPLVEARTAGCPVIASDLPVFAELADAGVFLYDRYALASLVARLHEHLHADRRGEVGRMPAFLWRDSARQCLQVLEELLATPAAASATATASA